MWWHMSLFPSLKALRFGARLIYNPFWDSQYCIERKTLCQHGGGRASRDKEKMMLIWDVGCLGFDVNGEYSKELSSRKLTKDIFLLGLDCHKK